MGELNCPRNNIENRDATLNCCVVDKGIFVTGEYLGHTGWYARISVTTMYRARVVLIDNIDLGVAR